MNKLFDFCLFVSMLLISSFDLKSTDKIEERSHFSVETIYNSFELPQLDFNAFKLALNGYSILSKQEQLENKNILTIVDFTKASTEKRLFLLDLKNRKVLVHCLVAHGKNTGENYAKQFSNIPQSYQSSLGFFIADQTYYGKHDYSIRLEGMEQGFNGKAKNRNIVIHGADYVSEEFIQKYGRLGRSFGCPALPVELSKEIIQLIDGKSCLFIYYPEKKYLAESELVNAKNSTEELLKANLFE